MVERRRKVAVGRVEESWRPEYERLTLAIDAGREALALLREGFALRDSLPPNNIAESVERLAQENAILVALAMRALLARAEEK